MKNTPELVESSTSLTALKDEFLSFTDEFGENDEHLRDTKLLRKDLPSYLKMLVDYARGVGLPEGWVPGTMYWYLAGNHLIGTSSLRHWLTPALQDIGGHVGYAIRPSDRRKGFGTQLLALTLEKAREMGLSRVLLTTDIDNIASQKVIERNGGEPSEDFTITNSTVDRKRYWITLK